MRAPGLTAALILQIGDIHNPVGGKFRLWRGVSRRSATAVQSGGAG
jgi:hypothetical protein